MGAKTGGGYSAGAIFLQVVPVFKDVQNDTEAYAKNLNQNLSKEMDKAGKDIGERAGQQISDGINRELEKGAKKGAQSYAGNFETTIKNAVNSAEKEISRLDFSTATDAALKNLEKVKASLKDLKNADFNVDFDPKKVLSQLEVVRGRVDELTKGDHEVNVDANLRKVYSDIDKAVAYVDAELAKKREFQIGAKFDPKIAERAMGEFEKRARSSFQKAAAALGDSFDPQVKKLKDELERLANSEVGIDINDKEVREKVIEISEELRKLGLMSPSIEIKTNALASAAELEAYRTLLGRIDGKDVHVKVDADGIDALITNLSRGGSGLDLFKAKGDAASSTFRSLNPLVAALALLLPTIGPAGAAAAGGLLAIGPAAIASASGIGVLVLGLSGIADAVKALSAQQDASAKTTATSTKALRTGAQQVQSAEQSLADAERNAARAQADAARQVAEAKRQASRSIADALDAQKKAQEDYAQSVVDVQKAEKDLADARKQAKQDQEDLQNQIADNQLSIRQGLIDEFNAQVALNAAKADGSSTPVDIDQAQINYDQAVQSMKELRQEQQRLQDQQKDSSTKGVNGSDTVVNAQNALNEAIQKQKDAYDNVNKTAKKVHQAEADGARNVAAAERNAARSRADNAESIAKAKQAVDNAKASAAEAALSSGDLAAANQKVVNSMANLGPAGQAFARYIFSLKKGFQDLRSDVETELLPPIQAGLTNFFDKYGARAHGWIVGMAHDWGTFETAAFKALNGPVWDRFFKTVAKGQPGLDRAFGKTAIALMNSFASIMTAVAPYTERFAVAVQHVAESFAQWTASKKGQDGIQGFMEYARKNAQPVVSLLVAFAKAALAIVRAAAPLGGKIMGGLTDFFNFVANIPQKTLATILKWVISVTLAVQGAAVAGTIILSVSAAFGSALQMLITLLILTAYHSQAFRDALKSMASWMVENREGLTKLATVLGLAVLGFKALKIGMAAYKVVSIGVKGAQLGLAAATHLGTDATVAQTTALRLGAATGRAYAAISAAIKLAQEGMLGATIKMNAQMLIMIARQRAAAAGMLLLDAAMDANPISLIVLAIAAVVTVLAVLFVKNKTVHDFLVKSWQKLQSVGKAVFGAISTAVKTMWNKVSPFLTELWKIAETIGKIWWTVWTDIIKIELILMLAAFKLAWLGIKALWNDVLKPVFKAVGSFFRDTWKKVISPALDAFGKAANKLWKNVLKPVFDKIGAGFSTVGSGIKKVWDKTLGPLFDTVMPPVIDAFKRGFNKAIDAIGSAWDGLKKIFAAPIKFVVDTVLNNGLFAGVNKLADWVGVSSLKIKPIKLPDSIEKYATGGVLPGYTPGRDVHSFVSPTGGRLMLSGGEAIMRPEFTRAVGTGFVDSMNALARTGGVGAVRRALGGQAFAKGGTFNPDQEVYLNGMGISRIAAAQVAIARKKFGIPIYMIQGGFGGNHVAASGTSHNYPGVGDFGPGSISLETALRKVGFAAWARNIPGRSSVGSGAHVHAVSLLDPGDASSPQVYGSWANHGNGLSGANNDPAPHPAWLPGLRDMVSSMGIGQIASLANGAASGGKSALSGISHLSKVLSIVKNPFNWVKNLVMGPLEKIKDKVSGSKLWQAAAETPKHLVKGVTDMVWSKMPGAVKTAAGWAGDAAQWVVGGAKDAGKAVEGAAKGALHAGEHAVSGALSHLGFAEGGILPYNGTMKYDNGGYLPPGLTSVVNLTGKPEPVFTSDQWGNMGTGGETAPIHYEPHFEGSDLTAGDVAQDLNFEFRRLSRSGKYGGPG